MRVILDGTEIDDGGDSLGGALAAAGRRSPGRLVIEVVADGEPAPAADLDQPPADEPYAERLEIRTANAAALVAETLHQAADELGRLSAAQRSAAEKLQAGETEQALGGLPDILTGWAAVADTARLAGSAPGVALPRDERAKLETLIPGLLELLGELRSALQTQDLAGLADCLGYDMEEAAESWRTLLRSLAAGATSDAA